MSLDQGYLEKMRKNALNFLRDAEDNFNRGEYGLVILCVEQFLQLYLRYLLLSKMGVNPRTKVLGRLMKEAAEILNAPEIRILYENNLDAVYIVEASEITSQYMPKSYEREIASRVLEFARKSLRVLRSVEKGK